MSRIQLRPEGGQNFFDLHPTKAVTVPGCGEKKVELIIQEGIFVNQPFEFTLRVSSSPLPGAVIDPLRENENNTCPVVVALGTLPSNVLKTLPAEGSGRTARSNLEQLTWTAIGSRPSEVALKFTVNTRGGSPLLSLGHTITIEPSRREFDGATQASEYVSNTDVLVESITPGFLEPGHRYALSARVMNQPVSLSPGLARDAKLRICLSVAGAARGKRTCSDYRAVLNASSSNTVSMEIEVDQEGSISLRSETELTYQVDGLEKKQSGPALVPVGKAEMTAVARAKGVASGIPLLLSSAGGITGVALLFAGISGLWLKRRQRRDSRKRIKGDENMSRRAYM